MSYIPKRIPGAVECNLRTHPGFLNFNALGNLYVSPKRSSAIPLELDSRTVSVQLALSFLVELIFVRLTVKPQDVLKSHVPDFFFSQLLAHSVSSEMLVVS